MGMPPIWTAEAAVWATWGASALFAVFYSLKAPWWQSPMGWNLFGFDLCLFLLTLPTVIGLGLDVNVDNPFWQWFAVASLTAIALFIVHRVYLLFRAQDGWNFWGRGSS